MDTIRLMERTAWHAVDPILDTEGRPIPILARRWFVGLTYLSYAALIGAYWFDTLLPGPSAFWHSVFILCAWALGASAHICRIRTVPDAVGAKESVRRVTLYGLGALGILYCLARVLLAGPGESLPYHLGTLFWGGLLLVLVFPTAAVAWEPHYE